MENWNLIGRWLVVAGLAIAVVGGVVWLAGKFFNLDSFPGTLRVEGRGFTCVFPLLLSIVLSVVLTLGLNLLARWFNK